MKQLSDTYEPWTRLVAFDLGRETQTDIAHLLVGAEAATDLPLAQWTVRARQYERVAR